MTANLDIQDKINLLAYVVPRFGSEDEEQEEALDAFMTALKPTYEVIRRKCPSVGESDVQLLGTELCASEVLNVGRSKREEFAAWLEAMSSDDLMAILKARKSVNEQASAMLQKYRDDREDTKAKYEEQKKLMEEQIVTARKERTMTFEARTGKFKYLNKK